MSAQPSMPDSEGYSDAFDPIASKYSDNGDAFNHEAVDEGDEEGGPGPAEAAEPEPPAPAVMSQSEKEVRHENLQLKERIRHLEEELESAHRTASTIEELAARLDLEEKKREEAAAHGDPVARIAQLEDELLAKSHECVEQGEKNFKLADALELKAAKLKELQADLFDARSGLVAEIAGGEADPRNFTHVTIVELCRLATKQYGPKKLGPAGSRTTMGRTSRAPSTRPASAGAASGGGRGTPKSSKGSVKGEGEGGELPQWSHEEGGSERGSSERGGEDEEEEGPASGAILAERQIKSLRERNRKLSRDIEGLENKLRQADALLRKKRHAENLSTKFADKVRYEREGREVAEEEIARTQEKVEALSEHIEKLMTHLKHEAAAKAKAYEAQRRAEKEVQLLRNRNAALAKKNNVREKVVVELKEGCKILEDQLRLMDEKYIELRGKLDWTRAHAQKEMKKAQNYTDKLRRQVLMAQSMGELPLRLDSPPERGADASGYSAGGDRSAVSGKTRTSTLMGMKSKKKGGVASQVWATKKGEVRDVPSVDVPEGLGEGDEDPSLPWSESKTSTLRGRK